MKKGNQLVKSNLLISFCKNGQGVYSVMMAGLSFVILAVIIFAVDGSGLFLDKARFSQGLEQGTLALVAENNKYRENKAHEDVLRQNIASSGPKKLSAQQEQRNKEILQDISRHYYYPSSYFAKGQTIEDSYSYECKDLAKGVACEVQGSFDRPSWLYGSNSQLSFAKTIQLTSDKMYAQKSTYQGIPNVPNQDKKVVLDVMFVLDLSGSMEEHLKGHRKISILVDEVKKLAGLIFNNDSSNRIGYVGFGWGARQTNRMNDQEKCVMPYAIDYDKLLHYDPMMAHTWYYPLGAKSPRDYYEKNREEDQFGRVIPPFADHNKTFEMIDSFDGNPISGFYKYGPVGDINGCLLRFSKDVATTDLWFSKKNESDFYNAMELLRAGSNDKTAGTLSTSGLLVGANLILSKEGFHHYKVKSNEIRRKLIIIVSDGSDQHPFDGTDYGWPMIPETKRFLDNGLCNRIRKRLNAEQSPLVAPAMIGFIALGYSSVNVREWSACTDNTYYVANSRLDLSKAFEKIIEKSGETKQQQPILPKQEEVGHSLPSQPKDWK